MRIIIEVLDGSSTTQIAMTAIAPSCVICFLVIEKPCDRFLVHSRSHFHVQKEIQDLAVVVRTEISNHICKKCLGLLKKRHSLKKKFLELDQSLSSGYRTSCQNRGIPVKTRRLELLDVEKKTTDNCCQTIDSGPTTKDSFVQTDDQPSNIKHVTTKRVEEEKSSKIDTGVFVRAEWNSGAREKQLPCTYHLQGIIKLRLINVRKLEPVHHGGLRAVHLA